ncbi:glycoside hydrolase family 3 protein [Dictyobacter arantiisoli]|uniref:beta-N-acetylhexosaminidase n=1 Tax=Dictyobacter arantiisoli TaxID=2014874 RepID=A0A5A5TBI9_9CHLR|nr:glycoside hydrolase family 3 N-terminal domain-containing protein [Dictyobacter arantiisoli]GCF08284.1 hypothetical protein KDI_18480 [Dictyobacter arantiisoli]
MQKDNAVHRKQSVFYSLLLFSCLCLLSGCSLFSFDATSTSAPEGKIISAQLSVDPVQVKAQSILNKMTLDEKLAQMIMVDYWGTDYVASGLQQMVAQQQVGGVLYQPSNHNFDYPNNTIANISAYSVQINADAKVAPLIANDEEGGSVDKITPLFPPSPAAEQLAQSGQPNVAYRQAALDASELKQLGINVDFAPVVDVGPDTNLMTTRMFSSDPGTVATYAGTFVKGLQDNGVLGTLKHFPGLGLVPNNNSLDPHNGLPVVSRSLSDLQKIDFLPYQKIIQQDNPAMIMTTDVNTPALDNTPGIPAELSSKVITYLRQTLKFNGVIITDALNMAGLYPGLAYGAGPTDDQKAAACVQSVEAGNDMLEGATTPAQVTDDITTLEAAINQGAIKQSQIDQSVMRILMMKIRYGIIK